MTISTNKSRWDLLGTGGAGPFVYDNKILSTSHLYVYVDTVLKTINTHYTVTGIGSPSGGNVTFTGGNEPALNAEVLLLRIVPLTQLSDYINHDAFNAEILETDLDKAVMIAQQFDESMERIVKLPITSTITDLILPEPIDGGEHFRWKSDKSGLELVNIGGTDVQNVITTQGDIVTGGAGGIAQRLGVGTTKKVLKSQGAGSDLVWGDEADVTLTARGDILYRNATVLARLAAGTSGQILKTKGSSANPVWANHTRRLVFPASCFETRAAANWAEFVQVQGTNLDWGELRFDTASQERADSPPFRLTNWDGNSITLRIGWKAAAIAGGVVWSFYRIGRIVGEQWDFALVSTNLSPTTAQGTTEYLNESVYTGVPGAWAENDAANIVIQRIVADAGDDMAGDAKLLYVEIEYTEA